MKKPQILIICGPTASGKSGLAVEVAKRLNGEVVSADSMQIYKKLQIGTAKPTIDEMEGIPHHMIDCVDPVNAFSVSDYEKMALPIINDIISRGRLPIVCGGTGFYINSLLYSFSYGNSGGENVAKVRQKYKEMAETMGNDAVYQKLQEVDPDSASKLHQNDVVRVIRALEIYETTGVKKSEIVDDKTPRFTYLAYSPAYDRAKLYERIDVRVDIMLENGWKEEVEMLLKEGVSANSQAMQAIGYREIASEIVNYDFLHSTMIDIIKQNSRNYAKRQITFFKKLPNLQYLPMDGEKESFYAAVDAIVADYHKFSN